MDEVLEVHPPADAELNPQESEHYGDGAAQNSQTSTGHDRTSSARGINRPKRRDRRTFSRWEPNLKVVPEALTINLQHWKDVQNAPQAKHAVARELVQKILYADAMCKTSTPNWILDKILKLS